MRLSLKSLASFVALTVLVAAAAPPAEKIYDEAADAAKEIAAAEMKAVVGNKRVLLLIGGNWCSWCYRLHTLFKTDKDVAAALNGGYEVVNLDIGKKDKNQDVLKKYGIVPEGYPYLVVLDPATDKLLVQQETGALEEGDHHSPAKVIAFLNKNRAPVKAAEK